VKTIASAIGIARSNLIKQLEESKASSSRRYSKAEDSILLPKIGKICDVKASYGYRRVCALLNRELILQGEPLVNHKRIYRIMRDHELLLSRYAHKPTRTHDGQVITLKSNSRWCSDTMTIKCFNGEKVEVAFALDSCDREAISYIATVRPMTGADIKDLIAQSVEARFGFVNTLPHPIQWLSDNGPPYIAHNTRRFALDLGFLVCNTPSYSPESNGMSEAFVKTFKRDYVYLNDLTDSQTVIKQLPAWFNDYNENAPHKGLTALPDNLVRKYSTIML
jgi:putative transposase